MKTYRFAEHLEKYGPRSEKSIVAVDEGFRYCRDLANSHYENFSVVTWLLPRSLRQHFANVYAYCRWSDDLADEDLGDYHDGNASGDSTSKNEGKTRSELLKWWRSQLYECFLKTGRPVATHPVMRALAETIHQYGIPRQPFSDLIDAFEQDQTTNRYQTFDDLLEYCSKSANPVGRIVLHLGRSATDQNIHLSDKICTGLQLANFWQDVARDYAINRIYIPQETLARFDYNEDDLGRLQDNDCFQKILEFEVSRAEDFFREGAQLAEQVDKSIAKSVELFIRGGMAILQAIRKQDFMVWTKRPKLTKLQKFQIICRSMLPGSQGSIRFAPSPPSVHANEGTQ